MASSSYLKSERRQKVQERETLVGRKQGVDRIMSNVDYDLSSNINNINSMISFCVLALERGVKGRDRVKMISQDIWDENEKSTISDNKLSSTRTKLSDESSRCQSKITTLNSEISSLDYQIRIAEQREAKERRKALEDTVKKIIGGE